MATMSSWDDRSGGANLLGGGEAALCSVTGQSGGAGGHLQAWDPPTLALVA